MNTTIQTIHIFFATAMFALLTACGDSKDTTSDQGKIADSRGNAPIVKTESNPPVGDYIMRGGDGKSVDYRLSIKSDGSFTRTRKAPAPSGSGKWMLNKKTENIELVTIIEDFEAFTDFSRLDENGTLMRIGGKLGKDDKEGILPEVLWEKLEKQK